jgi:hypothetical protein
MYHPNLISRNAHPGNASWFMIKMHYNPWHWIPKAVQNHVLFGKGSWCILRKRYLQNHWIFLTENHWILIRITCSLYKIISKIKKILIYQFIVWAGKMLSSILISCSFDTGFLGPSDWTTWAKFFKKSELIIPNFAQISRLLICYMIPPIGVACRFL